MQILVQVLCTKGGSLREAIAKDRRIDAFSLTVTSEKQPGRHPGWMKLHGADSARGALNVEWDAQLDASRVQSITTAYR